MSDLKTCKKCNIELEERKNNQGDVICWVCPECKMRYQLSDLRGEK